MCTGEEVLQALAQAQTVLLGEEDIAPVSAQDPQGSIGPAALLLQVGGQIHGAQAGSQDVGEVDAPPAFMQGDGGGEVFCDRILGKAADFIESLSADHHVCAADKGGVPGGFAGTEQVVEHGLLIVGPARHGVVQVAVILPGLDPTDARIGQVWHGLEQEIRFGHLIGIEDHDQGVARGAHELTGIFNIASFGAARLFAGDALHAHFAGKRLYGLPTRCSGDVAIIADDDIDLPPGIRGEVAIAGREGTLDGGLKDGDALVDGGDKDENGGVRGIAAGLHAWLRAGPERELQAQDMQPPQKFRKQQWYRQPQARPVDDFDAPAQVIYKGDAHGDREQHGDHPMEIVFFARGGYADVQAEQHGSQDDPGVWNGVRGQVERRIPDRNGGRKRQQERDPHEQLIPSEGPFYALRRRNRLRGDG